MFETNINNCLTESKKITHENDDGFVIDISTKEFVLFQIISSNLLTGIQADKSSYTVHISFDDSFPESAIEEERFKKLNNYTEFIKSESEGIITYQIQLEDTEKIKIAVKEIIERVYEVNPNLVSIDIQK